MKPSPFRAFVPVVVAFILISSFLIVAAKMLVKVGIDPGLVITGNCILFGVTIGSFSLFRKALFAHNTHAFLRNVYSALILKFFILLAVAFVYIYATGGALNKAGFLTLTGLYFLYMFFEVAILMNLSRQIRQDKNA